MSKNLDGDVRVVDEGLFPVLEVEMVVVEEDILGKEEQDEFVELIRLLFLVSELPLLSFCFLLGPLASSASLETLSLASPVLIRER